MTSNATKSALRKAGIEPSKAQAVPRESKGPPVSRAVLWASGIVWITVPSSSEEYAGSDKTEGVAYLRSKRSHVGGHSFVHYKGEGLGLDELRALKGERVAGRISIESKKFADGSEMPYVNIDILSDAETMPTCRFRTYGRASELPQDERTIFSVPVGEGLIAILAPVPKESVAA
jgi:hypothetical protein